MGFLGDVFNSESGRYSVTGRSTLGTWSMIQGVICMTHGLSIEFYPKIWSMVGLSDEDSAAEGSFRATGFTVFYIGLFYFFAGLADNSNFAAVSVFVRCVFVTTLFSGFLGLNGYIPVGVAWYFGLADLTFAIVTFILYQKQNAGTNASFFHDVFSLSLTCRSTFGTWSIIQGVIYIFHGMSIEFYPKIWSMVGLSHENSAAEGWFRGVGFTVFYIGLFYFFAGLADNSNFAIVSVFMRCVFVPTLFSGFLGLSGYLPVGVVGYFGLADPTFAIITFILHQKNFAGNDLSYSKKI